MKKPFSLAFLFLVLAVTVQAQVVSWKAYYAPDYAEIRDVSYANNRFVAVGDDNTMLYSSTGASWTAGKLPSGLNCHLNATATAFGQFFAGGVNTDTNKAVLLLSLDGITWADITSEVFDPSDFNSPEEIYSLYSSSIAGVEKIYLSVKYQYRVLSSLEGKMASLR